MAKRDIVFLSGDEELDQMLRELEPTLERKAWRVGTKAGAEIVLSRAQATVPTLSGTLFSTLRVGVARGTGRRRLRRGKEQGHMVFHKKTSEDDPFYAVFLEWGTQFIDALHYLRTALYDSRAEVVAASREAMKKAIPQIAAKWRAKIKANRPGFGKATGKLRFGREEGAVAVGPAEGRAASPLSFGREFPAPKGFF